MADKTLSHHSYISITAWGPNKIFDVRTAEGFASQYGKKPEIQVNENIRNNKPLVDALQEHVEGYDAAMFRQNNRVTEVSEGEIVSIEGRLYKVRLDREAGEPKFDPA
jgi:hypothetical protein